jgi:hypothetical protein
VMHDPIDHRGRTSLARGSDGVKMATPRRENVGELEREDDAASWASKVAKAYCAFPMRRRRRRPRKPGSAVRSPN